MLDIRKEDAKSCMLCPLMLQQLNQSHI